MVLSAVQNQVVEILVQNHDYFFPGGEFITICISYALQILCAVSTFSA